MLVYLLKIILLFLLILFSHCSSYRSTNTSKNKSFTLAKEDQLNAQFYFFKNNDTSSIQYVLLNPSSLLYARLDTGLQFYASIKIATFLYSLSKNTLTDSSSKTFFIPQNLQNFLTQFPIRVSNDNYSVKIIIYDLNRKVQYTYFTELKLNNESTRNNFLITLNDNVLFKPYVYQNNEVKIYHYKKFPQLYVDVFKYNYSPAPPPFSNISPTLNYLPDSSFTLSLINNEYYTLKIQSNVFYHIRTNTNSLDGLTIFSIDSIFPNIKDAKEMLYTSRYIMNKNEFEKCNYASNMDETKKCIDNFWIQLSGSKERAKEVIKNYYQRVIEANRLFTSHKFGWQTDRGMIYIIFGVPENIEKSYTTEKWFYSVNGVKNALVFTFQKNKNNPFTNSDFILERSDFYKDIWYIQVEKIRQGRLTNYGIR